MVALVVDMLHVPDVDLGRFYYRETLECVGGAVQFFTSSLHSGQYFFFIVVYITLYSDKKTCLQSWLLLVSFSLPYPV